MDIGTKGSSLSCEGQSQRHANLLCTMGRSTLYEFECRDRFGNLKWVDSFYNQVTYQGLNDSLEKHFKGVDYTAAWYVGLLAASPTMVVGDTMASHTGWTEITSYSEATRQPLVLGSVASQAVSNSASKAVFTFNADDLTIGGAFLCSSSTKGGTTGILYGGGAFNRDKPYDTGDTVSVTLTLSAVAV